MKHMSKLLAVLLVGVSLMGSAFAASGVHFGNSKNPSSPLDSAMAVYNFTLDSYTINYHFNFQNTPLSIYLGPQGSSTSSVTFNIIAPDTYVTLDSIVDNQTGFTIESGGSFMSGSYGIYPSGTSLVRFK